MAAAAPVIRGEGTTADYLRQKASVKSIFDTFAKTDDSALNEVCWDALPEETLCSKPVYERFSYYLMHVHPNGTDSKGNPRHGLDGSTATKYLGIMVNLAADKFKASGNIGDTKQFFSCLDKMSTSPEALWLRKLKSNPEHPDDKRHLVAETSLVMQKTF